MNNNEEIPDYDLFMQAVDFYFKCGAISQTSLQRKLKITTEKSKTIIEWMKKLEILH